MGSLKENDNLLMDCSLHCEITHCLFLPSLKNWFLRLICLVKEKKINVLLSGLKHVKDKLSKGMKIYYSDVIYVHPAKIGFLL